MRAVSANLLLLLASCCVWHCSYAVPKPEYDLRIYGGHPVKITEVPYMARYETVPSERPESSIMCGAVIVHEQFLLTAAPCAKFTDSESVIVGTDRLNASTGEQYFIEKTFQHPKYDGKTDDYSMGMIKLKKKLKLSDRVQVIKMANHGLIPKPGDMMKMMGFGGPKGSRTLSKELLLVELPYVDLDTCRKAYSRDDHNVTERSICAGGEKGRSGSYGDGGGPLVYKDHVMGVGTWNHLPFGTKSYPVVFAYVASMRDFIDDVIKNNS